MTRRIIECIPNFSEGRHTEVIDTIENAIVEVPGILLLDRHIDATITARSSHLPAHRRLSLRPLSPPSKQQPS